jgi:hypothetical protein
MLSILGDFNFVFNFNDLQTNSLEVTFPIHASLPFSAVNPDTGNYCINYIFE